MRLMYVEDNPANLFLVQRIARMGNHDVIHYSDGQTALDSFERDRPDLVLMDVQLPGKLNGLDVVRLLRQKGHKTPIVAVTAYAMVGDRERCLEAGCDSYISKPLPVSELVEMIKRFDPKSTTNTSNMAKVTPPAEPKPTSTGEIRPIPLDNGTKATPAVESKPETQKPSSAQGQAAPIEIQASPAQPKPVVTEPAPVNTTQPTPASVTVQETVPLPEKQPDKTG